MKLYLSGFSIGVFWVLGRILQTEKILLSRLCYEGVCTTNTRVRRIYEEPTHTAELISARKDMRLHIDMVRFFSVLLSTTDKVRERRPWWLPSHQHGVVERAQSVSRLPRPVVEVVDGSVGGDLVGIAKPQLALFPQVVPLPQTASAN